MRKLSFATLPGYLWTGFLTISLETFGVSPLLNFISHFINEFIINEFIYKPKHYITKNYFQITIIIIYSLTSYRTISYVHCFIVCILQSMLRGLRSPLTTNCLDPHSGENCFMRKLSFATLAGYLWTGFLIISMETFGVSPLLNFISHFMNEFIYNPKH